MCYSDPKFVIKSYYDDKGRSVIRWWLDKLSDKQARTRIASRISRLEAGNFGDHKLLQEGVSELRIDYGPGYRVYYSVIGKEIILLLCGGDKRKQTSDISKAIEYLKNYKKKNI